MSVTVCSPAVEVEETALIPPNAKPQTRGRKLVDNEVAGRLQLELLERVDDIFEKMGKILSRNFHKLPTKAQELGSSTGPGDLLQRLNLLTRDHVLDGFFQQNNACRQLLSELLSCRYSYLKEQESRRLQPLATDLTSKDTLSECMDAYDGFDPVHTDAITLSELELVEKMWSHMDKLLSKESVAEVVQDVPNAKEALTERFSKLSDDLQKYQSEFQKKIFSHLPAKSGIELEMTIERCDSDGDEVMEFESELPRDLRQQLEDCMTSDDPPLQPYKGWNIEGPKIQLARAKNLLADCDIDRTADWEQKLAELTEYLAHLQSEAQGNEDWSQDLEDVLNMLEAHELFENYHYGNPQLILDFPTDVWPKQSKRLPPLPGPEITLRPGRRDLTAPRRLLHVDVASAYDQQYELPAEVLKRDYLEPYWKDSEEFWAAGPSADATEPANLAACENEAFEECMHGDMAQTAKFLEGKGSFRPPQSHDGALKVNRGTLEAFARFHGGRRAAVQQCLRIFNHDENRKMCSSLRVLALPEPVDKNKNKRPDAGILFTTKKLANPPRKESRDPWAYTRCFQQLKKEELHWAQRLKKSSFSSLAGKNEVGTTLPQNWKGPVLPDQMSFGMKKTYEHLRRCQKIQQGLKRAAMRAPRAFITTLLKAVEAGLAGDESATREMHLRFGEHEYKSPNGGALANIRPTEAAWLEYVCQPSRNRPYMLEESLGRLGEILLSRVAHMMNDINPQSLFWDTKPKLMRDFLKELNVACRGPVKRYRFTEKDVTLLAPKLQDLKMLRIYTNIMTGEWMLGRPETEFHPEDLVKWPDYELQQRQQQHFSEQDSVISGFSEDFYEYPKGMPRRQDVISLRDFIDDPVRSPEWHRRTTNFFHCLGYRLGRTLKTLEKVNEQSQEKIRDADDSLLRAAISRWEDDVERVPNDPLYRLAEGEGSWRMTMTYQDMIKTADPYTYAEYQSMWANGQSQDGRPAWKVASEIVRKGLIREAYENKTMLWPLPLPYNSYATSYEAADPTTWRERLSKYWKGRESTVAHQDRVKILDAHIQKEEENCETASQKQHLKTTRCEPIWTFGHPSRKNKAHMFWDINNWPLHLQSESKRQIIASRGKKQQEHSNEATAALAEKMEIEQGEIPYWRIAEQQRKFVPGMRGFWMGDTALQKQEFEKRMKMKLAPARSKKRTWKDAFKRVVFGSSTKRKAEAISDDLPPLPADQIPQSQPTKKRRTQTLLQRMVEDEERDLFAVARGGTGIRETPCTVPISYTRAKHLERGEVTYYIPDVMDVDGPKIELGVPMKK
ncbi:hypothetical protein ACQKWADRAFT_327108 [Trichoderma austrokoningii]